MVLASTSSLFDTLTKLTGLVIGYVVTFLIVFWISLVVWTFRDVRSRTQDFLTQVLATALVAVFFVCGLFIYMILRPRQTMAEVYERQLDEESLLAAMTYPQTCNHCHTHVEVPFPDCPSS